MKRLPIFIILCLLCWLPSQASMIRLPSVQDVQAGMVIGSGGGESPTFDIEETWEGANEETWSALPSGWDDDYTTAPINGDQSLLIETNAGTIYTDTTSSGNYYAVVKIDNLNTEAGQGDAFRLIFAESDGTYICSLRLYYHPDDDEWYRMYSYHSGDSTSGGTIVFGTPFTAADPVVVKLVYEKGTGANGNVEVYCTSWSDYQSNGWTNAESDTNNTSTDDTADVGRLYIYAGTAGQGVLVDDIRGNTSDDVDY